MPDEKWAERVESAERLAQDIYRIADELARLHSE
jgi:hypothetical protein